VLRQRRDEFFLQRAMFRVISFGMKFAALFNRVAIESFTKESASLPDENPFELLKKNKKRRNYESQKHQRQKAE
jgi:hypothetical protein